MEDAASLGALLREQMGGEVGELDRLAGGEFSRAHAFTFDGRAYVVRVSAYPHAAEAFAKDDYAWRHFASPALPIPRVVAHGPYTGGHFAISQRVSGRRLTEHPDAERRALLPTILDTFDAIGRCDVSGASGFGGWDAHGRGQLATWREFLTRVIEDQPEGFYQGWHRLFETGFVERPVYERIYRAMLELAVHCPEERALLHNDYHFDNVLADGRRVTGVIDWGNSCYGDRLYDLAWVGWVFAKDYGIDAAGLLRERHGATPSYDERIACYTLHNGLDELRFFARTDRRERYEWTRDKLLSLL